MKKPPKVNLDREIKLAQLELLKTKKRAIQRKEREIKETKELESYTARLERWAW